MIINMTGISWQTSDFLIGCGVSANANLVAPECVFNSKLMAKFTPSCRALQGIGVIQGP